jgi:hypothetical protein
MKLWNDWHLSQIEVGRVDGHRGSRGRQAPLNSDPADQRSLRFHARLGGLVGGVTSEAAYKALRKELKHLLKAHGLKAAK